MFKNLFTGIIFFVAILFADNLYSQLPTAPINLNSQISYDGSNYVLQLSWQNDTEFALTDKFNIYIASGNTENPGDFSLSSTMTRTGDEITIYSYSHTFTVVDNYSVYITGENIGGEGPASEFRHFFAGPSISFTTTPGETELTGVVDMLYFYDVDAVATDGGSLTFSLLDPPIAGMSIDVASGSITWTPVNTGLYDVTVIAQHVDYPMVQETQSWQILVKSCNQPTYLSGYVYDQFEAPIQNANITAKSQLPLDTTVYYYATTDESGSFQIELLEGTYKVHVTGDNFISEWYANQELEFDANIVDLVCGQTKEIQIVVESFENHIISGYLTDENTGYPVFPGTVEILEMNQNKINNIYTVSTANDGFWSIELSNLHEYKLLAYDNYNPKRFIPMYYNNSYDFLESQCLRIENADIENLNFVLKEYPVSLNAINGKVRDNMGTGVKSMLVLYKHKEKSGVRTIDSDNEGNFSFRNLEPGKYFVRAIPYGKYTSGFYHISEEVIPHWFDATIINVDEHTEFIEQLMVVRATTNPTGDMNIYGTVFVNNNALDSKDEKIQADESIQGAVVYLLNSKNSVVDIRLTCLHGAFNFRNISSDHYTLKVDKIGYKYYTSDDVYVNEIDKSLSVTIYLDKHPHTNPSIEFKTTPATKANVGQLYSYDAEATTNGMDSIRYNLVESPEGMTVNTSTGLLNWTSESSGTYSVTLEAFLKSNPAVNIQQSWTVDVIESMGTSYLSVRVKRGEVVENEATLNLYSSDFSSTFTLTTDILGEAMFAVPNGEYYLHLTGDKFDDCWYNNKTDFADAEMLTLTIDDTLEIEALVTEKIIRYIISGVVSDNNAAPIEQASVHFILETGDIRTVLTDAEGKYSFEIGKDTSFRAFAVKDGEYTAQYYPSLYDFAETIPMENITSNEVNFQLDALPKSTVNIEGTILDESALPMPGVVIAYGGNDVDDGSALKFSVDFVNSTITEDGNYDLVVPISGTYIIRAYPLDRNYYPAYYSEEAEAVHTWLDAKIIEATGALIEDIYIKTGKVTPTSGAGWISGSVEIQTLVSSSGNYAQMDEQGFTVFAFDQQNNICKYTYSGGHLFYSLMNLALTQWQVTAEKVGLYDENATKNSTLSQGNTSDEINLFYLVSSSVDEDAEKVFSIYPNPAGNIINLRLKDESIFNSSITILDNLGNQRMTFENNGGNISFDVSSLPSGAYYIRVTNGLKHYTMPFVKIR